MKAKKPLIEKGSASVLADLGVDVGEAANLTMRADCMLALTAWYHRSGLTQAAGARQIGVRQPRLNALLKGAIGEFSLDALVNMAALAGLNAKLSIKAPKRKVA
jgi:predicted XRE-type DNA-binding protein